MAQKFPLGPPMVNGASAPAQDQDLMSIMRVLERGLVVTQFFPKKRPERRTFQAKLESRQLVWILKAQSGKPNGKGKIAYMSTSRTRTFSYIPTQMPHIYDIKTIIHLHSNVIERFYAVAVPICRDVYFCMTSFNGHPVIFPIWRQERVMGTLVRIGVGLVGALHDFRQPLNYCALSSARPTLPAPKQRSAGDCNRP